MAAVLLACVGVLPAHAASGPPIGSVAVVGDFGSGDAAEAAVARIVSRARPVAIVTTGDNVYDSADYAGLVGAYYGPWIAAKRFFPALGNHDHAEGVDAFDVYFPYLADLHHYTRIVGDVQYFILDSDAILASPSEAAAQRAWLSSSLRRSKTPWQVVVLHHPPYSSGVQHGPTPAVQWPYRQWGADLVLSGHEHQYERIVREGLTYVVDGAGGKDLYPFGTPTPGSKVRNDTEYGALFLTTTPSGLVGEFWSAEGRRLDRFTIPRR